MSVDKKRIIVGITGASGAIYGVELLHLLRELPVEVHLVISKAGLLTLHYETDLKLTDLTHLADYAYKIDDITAPIASGSFQTLGMIVAPCSVRSFSEMAAGTTSNLLTRAADVCLKEKRKLALLVREMPLHANHLKNLCELAHLGAIIAPPVPAFYLRPQSVQDIVRHTLMHVLTHFIDIPHAPVWKEPRPCPTYK